MNEAYYAIMLELKVSNSKLYDAENEGETELEDQRKRIEREGERENGKSPGGT